MSPSSTTAPATLAGSAATPARSEVASPSAKFGLWTKRHVEPGQRRLDLGPRVARHHDHRPRARGQRRLDRPAHQRLAADSRRPAWSPRPRRRRGSATRGPAASTIAAISAHRACAAAAASRSPSAGRRRPSPECRRRCTGTPASTRPSTQSKPFSFGERAQPGAPITGLPSRSPSSSRLPGSTGMPKCSIRPPAASSAAGMTSRRSVMAEAPNTTSASQRSLDRAQRLGERVRLVRARAAPRRCARRPGASRASRTPSVLSTTLGFRPGSSVETTPTRSGRKGATDTRRRARRRAGRLERDFARWRTG